jgi:hypothetical protein
LVGAADALDAPQATRIATTTITTRRVTDGLLSMAIT